MRYKKSPDRVSKTHPARLCHLAPHHVAAPLANENNWSGQMVPPSIIDQAVYRNNPRVERLSLLWHGAVPRSQGIHPSYDAVALRGDARGYGVGLVSDPVPELKAG